MAHQDAQQEAPPQMILYAPDRTRVPMNLRATVVSKILNKIPGDLGNVNGAIPIYNENQTVYKAHASVDGTTYHVTFTNESCTFAALREIAKWCEYHVEDALFKDETTFDTFDEDEYEKETAELNELPCYFDYDFMITLGGGNTLNQNNLPLFYNVMIAAEFLEIKDLVLLGGKYICRQISGKTPKEVRELLGIADDIRKEDADKIRDDAALHFTAPAGRPN